jgi:Fe-S-cluster-containing dehydrogenase component
MDRRSFLKVLGSGIAGVAGNSLIAPGKALAEKAQTEGAEFFGVLVDTTRCIGCRRCEKGCAEVNDKPIPDIEDKSVFEKRRDMSATQWTVVNQFETERGTIYTKRKCMHCNQAACASACLVKAMKKTEPGPVTWDPNCLGCRYCLVSCPFDVPKFDHHEAIPSLEKCSFCAQRLKEGKLPGCVEACPVDAIVFGSRRDVIAEANRRIYQNTDKYYPYIYGEHEAGGTSWLYLSAVPFDQIGFRSDIGTSAYPEYTTGFLYAVPFILLLWPTVMLGMSRATKNQEKPPADDKEQS